MSRLIPTAMRAGLVAAIAREADESDWDHLTQAAKTAMIGRWVTAPEIGGLLRPLLGGDAEVRIWITDVGLKRRSRDLLPAAEGVVRAVLGPTASVVKGSTGIKPAHCLASAADGVYYLAWDRASNARNLFWAALQARQDVDGLRGAVVAMIELPAGPTEPGARARLEAIGKSCALEVRWIEAT